MGSVCARGADLVEIEVGCARHTDDAFALGVPVHGRQTLVFAVGQVRERTELLHLQVMRE